MTPQGPRPGVSVPPFAESETPESGPLVEAIARRVVELLREETPAAGELAWTAARVAREVGMSVEWVRDHRQELGVVPMPGARPRLMFDPAAVRAWASACQSSKDPQPQKSPSSLGSRRRTGAASGTGVELLPIGESRRAA